MQSRKLLMAVAAIAIAFPALAHHEGVDIRDSYIRATSPDAPTAAAFMEIENHQAEDDRLLFATSDIAERVELHTHHEDADGVMRMIHVAEGFVIPALDCFALRRGAEHVMFMGLNRELHDGEYITLTLHFERSGMLDIEVVVDSARMNGHDGHGGHGEVGSLCEFLLE